MKIKLIAVGQKMPDWVTTPVTEYIKRIQPFISLTLLELPAAKRHKQSCAADIEKYKANERDAIVAALSPQDFVVCLAIEGKAHSTAELAQMMSHWQLQGRNIALIIGGPDGLHIDIDNRAHATWSLSRLTFPHPLTRIIVTEQLYRAISLLHGHPYHRE